MSLLSLLCILIVLLFIFISSSLFSALKRPAGRPTTRESKMRCALYCIYCMPGWRPNELLREKTQSYSLSSYCLEKLFLQKKNSSFSLSFLFFFFLFVCLSSDCSTRLARCVENLRDVGPRMGRVVVVAVVGPQPSRERWVSS